MKTYTDLEQSKKLTEILPFERADMYWKNGVSDKYIQCFTPFVIDEDATNVNFDYDVPCWSLAALLGVLPLECEIHKQTDGSLTYYYVEYPCKINKKYLFSKRHDNPIDACYEMILKLNEQNLFKKLLEEQ